MTGRTLHSVKPVKHRRRPASPEETARRKAWGKQWGGMISMYWQAKRAQAKG